jgi:tetratricopeptide (TPR) repeat protein
MNDALLWNEFGNIYLKMELYDEAISVYLKSIELNPDSGWTYSNLAYSYYKKGECGRAISLYRIGIPLLDNPAYLAITWNRLGDALRALKDVDNAIAAYKKADDLDMNPSLSSALANKQRPNPEVVPAQVNSARSLNVPLGSEKNHVDGGKQSSLGNVSGTRHTLPSALQAKEGQSPTGTRLIDNNRRFEPKQNTPGRIDTFLRPLDTKLMDTPGRLQANSGDKSSSGSSYEPKRPSLYVIPAPDLDQDQVREERQTNKIETDTQPIKVVKGGKIPPRLVEFGSQETLTAQNKEHNQSARGNPPRMESNINLEETLAKVHIYENITQANPNNDRAWDTLGKLYKSLGRFEDSIQAYKQAIDKAPGREVYYYYLGLLYSVTKQDEEAAWAFENVLKLNPDYVLAHSALAGIYRRMGFESKANDHISIALPKMDNESAYNLACFYAICGEADKALEFLQVALKNKDTTVEWIKSDPDLELLHNDPRYQKLILELDNDQTPQESNPNYYSSDLDGAKNKLLPLLNNSLSR